MNNLKAMFSKYSAETTRELAETMSRHSWSAIDATASRASQSALPQKTRHFHCTHPYSGVLHMAITDGHAVVQCCECGALYTHHRAHRWEGTGESCSRRMVVGP